MNSDIHASHRGLNSAMRPRRAVLSEATDRYDQENLSDHQLGSVPALHAPVDNSDEQLGRTS